MNESIPAQVLLIEDDPAIAQVLRRELEALGLSSQHASDGMSGLNAALSGSYILIILDLGLPKLGGMEVCRRVKEKLPTQPILILTGENDETSTVLGLEHGADDYVTKPFRPLELRARVRALLRRVGFSLSAAAAAEDSDQVEDSIVFDQFILDFGKGVVTHAGRDLLLTPTEFALLAFLLRSPKRVFSREALLSGVWGSTAEGYEQNIRSHVSRIRKKIAEAGGSESYLISKRGFGYQFAPE